MWLDVSGLQTPAQRMNQLRPQGKTGLESAFAPPQAGAALAKAQRLFKSEVELSPQASLLASRLRHLEGSTRWVPAQLQPARPARHWSSQLMAAQTWNWLEEAFPGCQTSPQGRTQALQQALREFSPGTYEHSKRVGELVLRFAAQLDLESEEQEQLEKAAEFKESGMLALQIASMEPEERRQAADEMRTSGKFHDIGKLAIPDHILHKPGPLTPEEREVVELHPLVGEAVLAEIPGFEGLLSAVRHHHERWDGSGYVDGLKGRKIPLHAQIISLSDTFDALTEDRPYRKAFTPQQACQEILRQRDRQFDPELAEAFVFMVLS